MASPHHLSLSLSKQLWEDLLAATLPIDLAQGHFDLLASTIDVVGRLGLRKRIKGLLGERRPPPALRTAARRASNALKARAPEWVERLDRTVKVDGEYRLSLDDMGSRFTYGSQRVGADAYLKVAAEGRIVLLGDNLEIPFAIEKRFGASLSLAEIRFDAREDAVIGDLRQLAIHLGDHAILQLLSRLGEELVERQLPGVNPISILKREQVEEMVGGLGGALKTKMGVETLDLEVTEDDLKLSVKFGFAQRQVGDAAHRTPRLTGSRE